jgi:hypothetical protein
MRALQLFLGWSRHPVRRQRILLPTLEPLDGRWLPSAVHLIAPAIPTMVVAPGSPRLVRLEAKETTNPGHAQKARPHVTPGPVLPESPDRGSKPPPSAAGGSDDDNGASPGNGPDSDEPTSPFSELSNRPGGMVRKDEVEVELVASSNDPDPLPHAQAHRLHAPSSLLADKPTGRRKTRLNSGPLIDRSCEARAAIHPAPRATAAGNRESAVAAIDPASPDWYGVYRGSDLVKMESPTTAAIAGRSQPADRPELCPAVAGPGEAAPRTWGIVLTGLASALAQLGLERAASRLPGWRLRSRTHGTWPPYCRLRSPNGP